MALLSAALTVVDRTLAFHLREPLADKPAWDRRETSTCTIIPVPRCSVRQNDFSPGPHVAAWFIGLSIRFMWSPVLVDGDGDIRPEEVLDYRVPLEADPNLCSCWGIFPRECKDEVVLFCAGNFHQFSSQGLAECLGLLPSLTWATDIITVAVELHPGRRTGRVTACEGKEKYFLLLLLTKTELQRPECNICYDWNIRTDGGISRSIIKHCFTSVKWYESKKSWLFPWLGRIEWISNRYCGTFVRVPKLILWVLERVHTILDKKKSAKIR